MCKYSMKGILVQFGSRAGLDRPEPKAEPKQNVQVEANLFVLLIIHLNLIFFN